MRGAFGCVVIGVSLAAGCSRPAPTPAGGESPAPAVPAAEGERPTFESELVATHTVNGGTGSSAHKSTRYDDGKPFTAVEHYSTTIKGGSVTLEYEVAFVAHRDGKDVYKVTYTIETAGGAETKTTEAAYDGKRAVLIEDQHGSLVLQPPSK